MALKIRKFGDLAAAENFLRGGIMGGDVSKGAIGLVGQSLTFTYPAGSVTFVTASRENDALLLADIKEQIEDALGETNIKVYSIGGNIAFVHPMATSAISLPDTDEAAKTILGFPRTTAISGKVYGPADASPPALLSSYPTIDNSHVFYTDE